jgi:F-type H+-transporting ATPase subunit b
MEFTNWHAVANIINFLLFVIIVAKFAGPPLAQALQDSREATLRSIREAAESRSLAEQTLATTQTRLGSVDAELVALVADAREMATKQAARLEVSAQAEVERLRAAAKAEIERERQAAVNELRQMMADQAFERAIRQLQSLMTPERQRDLVTGLIQKVGDGSLALK